MKHYVITYHGVIYITHRYNTFVCPNGVKLCTSIIEINIFKKKNSIYNILLQIIFTGIDHTFMYKNYYFKHKVGHKIFTCEAREQNNEFDHKFWGLKFRKRFKQIVHTPIFFLLDTSEYIIFLSENIYLDYFLYRTNCVMCKKVIRIYTNIYKNYYNTIDMYTFKMN